MHVVSEAEFVHLARFPNEVLEYRSEYLSAVLGSLAWRL